MYSHTQYNIVIEFVHRIIHVYTYIVKVIEYSGHVKQQQRSSPLPMTLAGRREFPIAIINQYTHLTIRDYHIE